MISTLSWRVIFCCIAIECAAIVNNCAAHKEHYCVSVLLEKLLQKPFIVEENSGLSYSNRYNNLKCGFVYSAHFHMYATRDRYSTVRPMFMARFSPNDIAFVYESIKIVNLLFYKEGVEMKELWLFYTYAQQMAASYGEFFENAEENHPDRVANAVEMHDFVYGRLENYLRSHCADNYYFDADSQQCCQPCRCAYYKHKLNAPRGIRVKYDYVYHLNAIKSNKTLLNELLDANAEPDFAAKYGTPFHSLSQLYFNSLTDLSVIDDFLRLYLQSYKTVDFLSDRQADDVVAAKIEKAKTMALRFWSEPDLSNMAYAGRYQQMIIGLLKVIVLNKIGRPLVHIRHRLLTDLRQELDFSSKLKKIIAVLTDFMDATALDQDDFFVRLKSSLNLPYMNNPGNQYVIIEHIQREIGTILNTWQLPSEYSLSKIDTKHNKQLDVKSIISSANDFVKLLKDKFGKYCFRYIHSYTKMVNDVTNKMDPPKMDLGGDD